MNNLPLSDPPTPSPRKGAGGGETQDSTLLKWPLKPVGIGATVVGGPPIRGRRDQITSRPFISGRAGNGACGSVWYQKAVEAMSSCKGR
jgi:hypothetical protein